MFYCSRDSSCQFYIIGGSIVKCSMGLYMLQLSSGSFAESRKSADLVKAVAIYFIGRTDHFSPSKSLQIRVTGMCTNSYICIQGQFNGFTHYKRISRMKPAGYVCRCYILHYFTVPAHFPGPEAFTQIAVKIYFQH